MTELIKRIQEQTIEFNKRRAELVEELKGNFHAMFTEIFDKHPTINYFAWTQYSPYFNDGDECTFSRHEINAYRFMEDEDYEEASYWEDDEAVIEAGDALSAWKTYLETGKFPADFRSYMSTERAIQAGHADREAYIKYNTYLMPMAIQSLTLEDIGPEHDMVLDISEMISALDSIPEDFYQEMFGNHAKVKVTREGVEVEEYDHD